MLFFIELGAHTRGLSPSEELRSAKCTAVALQRGLELHFVYDFLTALATLLASVRVHGLF